MAKAKSETRTIMAKPRIKRKGVHAKTKMSKNKGAALYCKPYGGQGR
jgi:hypothetical protein